MAEVKRHTDYEVIETNQDMQRLWKIIEETHKVFTVSCIASGIKKTARKEYQLMHQGAYESIITCKEHFDKVTKCLRHINIWKMPSSLNPIQPWIFLIDMPNIAKTPDKEGGQNMKTDKENEDKGGEEKLKPKHDMSKVKCFNCGKNGHIAPNFPEKDQEEEPEIRRKQFVTWEDEQGDEGEVKVSLFVTYEVYESVCSTPNLVNMIFYWTTRPMCEHHTSTSIA